MNLLARERLVGAYNKGYRIDSYGRAVNPQWKVLKPHKNRQGYLYINTLQENGIQYSIPYHRLLAYQKYGDLLFEADCVRHLNGDRSDNSYSNIELGTNSENMMDIPKEVRVAKARKMVKIRYNNVDEIREFHNKYHSVKKTMEKFGISSSGTLYYILHYRKILHEGDRLSL